jgi:hypothetical protein
VGFGSLSTDDRDARIAVGEARHYIRALRRACPWWRRAGWPLRPGPLRWRHTRPAMPAVRSGR